MKNDGAEQAVRSEERAMSGNIGTYQLTSTRWQVAGALPHQVRTAHVAERDPVDSRYARSICGRERARLWDEVDLTATDTKVEVCSCCAAKVGRTPGGQRSEKRTARRGPHPPRTR
jgi:hypothetical protein